MTFFEMMLNDGFKFHHYLNGEYTYYSWNNKEIEDKIPEMASSSEGAAAMILSPNMQNILLVYEYEKWKLVTGGVKSGDTILETCVREAKEEVDVDMDPSFPPLYLGGWNIKKAKYGEINDNLSCFAIKATSDVFKVDGIEITKAEWFQIEYLLSINTNVELTSSSHSSPIEHDGTRFSYVMLKWLKNYMDGNYLNITSKDNINLIA
jgi:8-oxo-dGTP pyrophosphatase MutT (NUDIX family)